MTWSFLQATLTVVAQTHGGRPEEITTPEIEAEIAKDEATIVSEKLPEAECEIKYLEMVTQRLMLTEEEMLACYWSLRVEHGIQEEIATTKHEYLSSFAPLPVEIVLAAEQRVKEGDLSCLRELALLKVEDAVALAMARHRRQNLQNMASFNNGRICYSVDEVKLPRVNLRNLVS
ncbi:hypothetical protein DITRI_Ditri07aG0043500 [Diplodiscus trichospermus]